MLGSSPAINPTTRTRLARGLVHRELDDFLFHADYFHHVKYFRLNTARFRCIKYVRFVDSICRTTYFNLDFVASNNKAKCFVPKSQSSFIFVTPEYSGAATLHHYSKFTDIRGCAITSLSQIYSITWWFSFLRPWMYLFRLSGIIFFGWVELFSST